MKFLEDDLWPTITRLAKKSRRGYVAVAYLARGVQRLLPLHSGDCLVIDMSKGAVKGGQTDPFEVEKYLKKGVRVYNCGNLHAKVFIFDATVIVCSANVSRRSKDTLIEVGLQCRDWDALAHARGFVRSLQKEEVTPGYVRVCKKLYRPPRMPSATVRKRGESKMPRPSLTWVLGVWELRLSEEEETLYASEEKKALKKVRDKQKYETAFIRWPRESRLSRTIEEGNFVVQVDHRRKDIRVLPPCRVVQLTKYKDREKRSWLAIWVEQPRRVRSMSFESFRAHMVRAGIKRLGKNPRRPVRNHRVADTILGLWK